MTRRSRILSFGCAGLLVLAGVASVLAFSGGTGQILALVLISLGFVLATALVFLEVGLSEDRERAREARERERRDRAAAESEAREAGRKAAGEHVTRVSEDAPRWRSRLGRERGRQRRLR